MPLPWPPPVTNPTATTQYIIRVNLGINDQWDQNLEWPSERLARISASKLNTGVSDVFQRRELN